MSLYSATLAVIEDLIGSKAHWPAPLVFKIFHCPLNYVTRVHVASFFYNNGVHVDLVIDLFKDLNKIDHSKERKIRDLYKYWDHETLGHMRRSKYFSYDIVLGAYTDLNGELRYPEVTSASGYSCA